MLLIFIVILGSFLIEAHVKSTRTVKSLFEWFGKVNHGLAKKHNLKAVPERRRYYVNYRSK